MFWLLMRTRLLSGRNVVLETWRNRPVVAMSLCLAGICLFGGMFLGFLFFFRFAAGVGVLAETIYQAFYYLFLLLFAGAVPFVASTLFQSADYSLLFAAPIPPRTVVAAKLLDATITNSLQFTIIGLPAIVAGAFALRLPAWQWPLVLLLIALFVLLPALLTALALLLALAGLGMQRLRGVITLVNVLMGVGVCATFVLEARNLPFKFGGLSGQPAAFQPALHSMSPSAHLLPSAWFASVVVGLAQREPTATIQAVGLLLRILLLCGGLFAACMTLGGRLLSNASVGEEHQSSGHIAPTGQDDARQLRRIVSAPIAAILVKDLKYVWRDTMLLSQLSVPLILFLVPYLIGLQNRAMGTSEARSELFPFSAVIITFILFIQTSILSLSLLGMEAQGFWLLLLAPSSRRALLWAKFLISVTLSGGLALVLSLVAGASFGAEPLWMGVEAGIIALCAAGLCGLGVGISAALPRFLHDNPALRVSPWALIVSFFTTTAYMLLTLLCFGFAFLAISSGGAAVSPVPILAIAFIAHLLLTLLVVGISMEIGARRIERYEWEH